MRYGADVIPVCQQCAIEETKTSILSKDSITKNCAKCGIAYCEHYSSDVDVRFCGNCMVDFKVTNSVEVRTEDHLNDEGKVVYSKRVHCKVLHLEGSDWLFTASKISTLSDTDLDATIEYHRAIAGLMLSEREERRVEKYQKLNKMVIKLQKRDDVDQTGAVKGSLRTPAQKAEREADKAAKKLTMKSKTAKVPDAQQAMDAVAILLKAGISKEQIAAMLGGKV